jgi:type IX secretion system PorP/SprF family membrane protein
LNGGVLNRHFDWQNTVLPDKDGQPVPVPTEPKNNWTADFDFGIEYNMERLTVGASVTHLNRTADEATHINMGHHFYGYVKYKFSLGFDFDLVPALFAQNSKKSTHLEVSTLLFYRNTAWIGAGYRCDEKFESESVVGIVGLDINNTFRIGYSFDYNVAKLKTKDAGMNNTHEIMLGIRLSRPQHIYAKTPRFFE